MSSKRKDVARAYITYRNERNRARQKNNDLMKVVKEKLAASNVQNQNANVDEHSFGGRKGEASNEVNKYIALTEYMSPRARDNHINNRIYTHDLDSYVVGMHNCLSIPLTTMLFGVGTSIVIPSGSSTSTGCEKPIVNTNLFPCF